MFVFYKYYNRKTYEAYRYEFYILLKICKNHFNTHFAKYLTNAFLCLKCTSDKNMVRSQTPDSI